MKDKFTELFATNITRQGAAELLDYLNRTDFFTAPASTRFHLSREGGLAEHSIHVFERLQWLCTQESLRNDAFEMPSDETIAICGLLHDLCKVNFYDIEMRNKKNERGEWEKVPFYTVNDLLPYGHGEKSVYIISGFMNLSREEAMAIRWHMGYSDTDFKGGGHSVGNAFDKFPLAVLTHIADVTASHIDESVEGGR